MEHTEHIDELVQKYQHGDTNVAYEIITAFEPYMKKYINMLKYNKLTLTTDTRKFLALFASDIETRKCIKNELDPQSQQKAYAVCSMLNAQLASVEEEDLWQDMCRILLLLASRYEDKNSSFTGYVYSTFIYELKRTIEVYIMDPINTYISIDNEDANIDIESTYMQPDVSFFDDELDDNWINGITCNSIFADLTAIDRKILKLYYYIGYTDEQIGKMLGLHKLTVFKKRHKILDQLREKSHNS